MRSSVCMAISWMMIFLVTTISPSVVALVVLPEIPASTDKALPVDPMEPNIPCDQILKRLEDYNSMARQHDASVASFLGEVSSKVGEWFDLLSPLEGQQQNLPIGVFEPLRDGAEKITNVTDLAWENSALLASALDRIRTSLGQCHLISK